MVQYSFRVPFPVTVSMSQGGSEFGPAPLSNAPLSIWQSRSTGISPAGVLFRLDVDDPDWNPTGATYFNHRHDLHVKWTFEPALRWTTRHEGEYDMPFRRVWDIDGTPTLVTDGSIPEGATFLGHDRTVTYGWQTGHTFAPKHSEFSGATIEYTVTCEVWWSRQATPNATLTTTVTIRDQDDACSDTATSGTYLVSLVGDFSDPPSGSYTTYTSISAAISARTTKYQGLSTANKALFCSRILLRRGEDFSGQAALTSPVGGLFTGLGAFGDPDDPLPIINSPPQGANATGEFAIQSLHYLSPFNFNAAAPTTSALTLVYSLTIGGSSFFTVEDCKFERGHTGIYVQPNKNNYHIGNTMSRDNQQYSFYGDANTGGFVIKDCYFWQPYDASTPGSTSYGISPSPDGKWRINQGPHRHACFKSGLVNAMHNIHLRHTAGSWAPNGNATYIQPAGRLPNQQRAESQPDDTLNCDNIFSEGSTHMFCGLNFTQVGANPDNPDAVPRNWRFRGNIVGKMPHVGGFVSARVPGMSVESCLFIIGDIGVSDGVGARPPSFIVVGLEEQQVGQQYHADCSDPAKGFVIANNNTFVDLRTTAGTPTNWIDWTVDDGNTDWRIDLDNNNMHHSPNRGGATSVDSSPVDTTPFFLSGFTGLRLWRAGEGNANDTVYTPYAYSNDIFATYKPQPGSPAYQTATTGRIALADLWGNIRLGTPNKGCL